MFWRLLVQTLLLLLLSHFLTNNLMDMALFSLMLLPAFFASIWVAARFLDRRPLADFGLRLDAAWWRDIGFGLVLGAFLMLLIFLVELAFGWITITDTFYVADGGAFGLATLVFLATSLAVGIREEMLSRGYHMTNFAQGCRKLFGPWGSLIAGWVISSVMFGLMHWNRGATVTKIVYIVVAGMFLFGIGYLLTGRLAISIGVHITWNFFHSGVFGFPVSGTSASRVTFIAIEQGGNDLLTGGAFGPTAGVVGLAGILVGACLIALWVRRREGRIRLYLPMTDPRIENDHLLSFLKDQYEDLHKIAEETFRSLGEERAMYFINLANDWIDILSAILDTYPKAELLNSLMYIYFSGLLKGVRWFQLLFFSGNYPFLHRNLRFVWEMIFRAYHVDTYVSKSPDDPEPPGPTIDDKVEWLAQHEREMFQWGKFMNPTLRQLLPQVESTEMEEYYKSLWDKLNEYVHPSKALLDRMVVGAPGFLMTDSFDKEWASETIEMATMIFDLVWLAVIYRFQDCAELIAHKGLLLKYPIVTAALENY